MTSKDLSIFNSLRPFSIGFDDMFDQFENMLGNGGLSTQSNYPPYNIRKTGKDKYSIEGFGLTYIEAARFGIPSIAGILGGAPEAVINKSTGWCVDPNNNELLVNILEKTLVDTKERRQLGKNALKRFEAELHGEKALIKLINIINQSLSR